MTKRLLPALITFLVLAFAISAAFNYLPLPILAGVATKDILCGFGPLLSGLFCYKVFRTPNHYHIGINGARSLLTYGIVALAVVLPVLLTRKPSKATFAVFVLTQLLYSFGEEFGWRHYLQNLTATFQKPAAAFLIGAAWFAWHYSILSNPVHMLLGQPVPLFIGIPLCVLFLSLLSLLFGDLVIKTQSILLPTIGHAITKFGDPISMGVVFLALLGLQVMWNRFNPTPASELPQPT